MSRFIDAMAPMTAKCIIRDAIRKNAAVTEAFAAEVTAAVIGQLRSYGYEIVATDDLQKLMGKTER